MRVTHLSRVHGITDHDERTFIAVLVGQVLHLERAVALPRLEDRLDTRLVLVGGQRIAFVDPVTEEERSFETKLKLFALP